tara:strand:- start:1659 stop:2384 length:726 start_codon:yes stop_codon:yes gene_type:complete
MIKKKDISVVIQGPIDDRTYEAIDCYQGFAEVIVSNWAGEDISLLDKAAGSFTLVQSTYQNDTDTSFNVFLAQTTMAGCLEAKTEYVLKTRSDELYPNLDKLIENLNLHPKRSHTTDNGFWRHIPHCYSNHLFIDKRDNVVKAMEYRLSSKKKFKCSESEFGYFLMKARGFDLSEKNWKKIFRDNVFITACELLPNHLHSGQTFHGRGFKRSSDPYPKGRMERKDNTHNFKQLYQHVDQIK